MRKHITLLLLAVFIFAATGAIAGSVSGIITMDFDLSRHPSDKEVRLWIPYPVSSPYQDITNMTLSGDFTGSAVYTDTKYQTPILYAWWPAGTESRKLTLSFKAVRQEVQRRDFPEKEAAWDPADYRMWLQPTSLGPIDGPVKKLADSITSGKATVLAKARAIYDWTCANTYRDPATVGCGKGDVCKLLKNPGGKCTDIHSVFVALCRAAGVPAREIFGVRIGKKEVQDISNWQHCWAEFYLPGYGWVPVDPADVRKMMLKGNLKADDPETKKLQEYFWGGWDAYRVKLAQGRDLVLNPAQQGGPLNTFGYPYAEVDGEPLNFYDPAAFSYTLTSYRITEDGFALIDTDGLKKLLDKGEDILLFDARSPEEYQDVHIKGALSLPQKQFDRYAHLLPADTSRRIIFYCNGVKCGKSRKAAKKAIAMGYENVFVYVQGIPVWEEKGMPIYAGPDYEKRIKTTKIAPSDLEKLLNSGNKHLIVVDVRDPEEFAEGHIPFAVNIPVAVFADRSGLLDRDKKIVVYCNSGGRSYNAYRKLMKLGYKDINQAIFADWKEAGLPVEKE